MREMLEPVFGESGAVVAQFLVTLAIILLVIGLVYWLVRRFAGVRFPGGGRGQGAAACRDRRRPGRQPAQAGSGAPRQCRASPPDRRHLGPRRRAVDPARRRWPARVHARHSAAAAAVGAHAPPSRRRDPRSTPPQPALRLPCRRHAPESSGISEPIPFPPQAAARPAPRRAAAASPVAGAAARTGPAAPRRHAAGARRDGAACRGRHADRPSARRLGPFRGADAPDQGRVRPGRRRGDRKSRPSRPPDTGA